MRIFSYKAIGILLYLSQKDGKKRYHWSELAYKIMATSINNLGCRLPTYKGYYFNKCSVYESFCRESPPSRLYTSIAMSYDLMCNKCNTNYLDPICKHSRDDNSVSISNVQIDHIGIVPNPELPGTGIYVTAMPLNSFVKELNKKSQKNYNKFRNEIDFVCSHCKINSLSLEELKIENWLINRGCSSRWIIDFIESLDYNLPIYDDKTFVENNVRNF